MRQTTVQFFLSVIENFLLCSAHFCRFRYMLVWDIRIYHDSWRNVKSRLYFPKNHVSGEPAHVMFWVWLKMRLMFYILIHDRCISFYILPLKYETCFPRFKQSLYFASRICVVLWKRHITKRTCTQRKRKREREERRGRETTSEKRFPEWRGFFLRFTTFLIVWNSLSSVNKGRKMSPSSEFHLDRFREHCATAYSISREHSEVMGSWAFSVNNFCLRFHFLITRSLGRRYSECPRRAAAQSSIWLI